MSSAKLVLNFIYLFFYVTNYSIKLKHNIILKTSNHGLSVET